MAYFGCILFCIFCLQVSQTWSKWWSVFVLYCFLGSKLCVSFYYANCFFVNYHRKNSCPDQIKSFFFVQLKVGGDANIFVLFLSFWLFGSKLIFTWLKTSRLLWQLWKRCPVVKDCSPITNRFFEWIIWWWS